MKVGVDLAKYDACLASGEAERRVEAESQILRQAGFEGLPTTYVGSRRLVGALPEADFDAAFQEAERGSGKGGVPGPLYLALVVLLGGVIVWLGRATEREKAA
jgi:predicted DsbA family dithiol-disulfide isomerase